MKEDKIKDGNNRSDEQPLDEEENLLVRMMKMNYFKYQVEIVVLKKLM